MFRFRNIDTFIPGKFEKMGMLKGKRWYINIEDKKNGQESPNVLFKPQRNEFADKKVFCANHYGELVGYLLAKGAQVPSCRAELARLSRYYENIHKERNRGTPEKKDGCIMYSELEKNQILDHGSTIIDMFALEDSIGFTKLSRGERENDSNNIQICLGTACYVKGADKVLEKLEQVLGIKAGETTPDGKFSIQDTRCVGACGLAPVMVINEEVYGKMTPDMVEEILTKYE